MTKKPVVFVIPADKEHKSEAQGLVNSLSKFHPDLPVFVEDGVEFKDEHFFYRAKPLLAEKYFKDYECVIVADSDQVVTGDISHVWEGDFDVAVVQNTNPSEIKKVVVNVWDIEPMAYVNAGFVVMKSERFIKHWLGLCRSPHFYRYQYREQDLLNILIFYGDYSPRFLDASNKWHGLASKGYWHQIQLKDKELILPKNDTFPGDEDKVIKIIHWAGGNIPDKMKFDIYFQPEVAEYLKELTK